MISVTNGGKKCRIPRFISCLNGDESIGRVCVRQCLRYGTCVPCQYVNADYEGPKAISYYTQLCKKHFPSSQSFNAPISICYSAVD